jgi:KipI family sensor histidine kinase inhibitor
VTIGSAAWFGDRAVLVTLADPSTRAGVAAGLAGLLPRCDVRPGMASVLVVAPEPDAGLLAAVELAATAMDPSATSRQFTPVHVTIPVDYAGEDLHDVAQVLGCGVDALVTAHQVQSWSVAMMGFAAGFGYLVPLGPHLLEWSSVARRDRPRERVPAGSVALAAGMSAVYPEAMPGGWHLLGLTSARMFDAGDASSPSLLHPSDVVHFVEVAQ